MMGDLKKGQYDYTMESKMEYGTKCYLWVRQEKIRELEDVLKSLNFIPSEMKS